MSETVARQRPSVDLDDFERRLRQAQSEARPEQPPVQAAAGSNGYDDDPLAELARLVGERHDPYGDVFAREATPPAPAGERREPAFGTPSPRFSADFAAIEAGLRGALAAHPETPVQAGRHSDDPHLQEPQIYAEHEQAYADEVYVGEQDWGVPAEHNPTGGRSRRPIYAMIATIAVGVIGIGVAFAYKGASSSPREIKTIMAAAGPTKIQPPDDSAASQDVSALDKSQAAPTKLVGREEQPVDLSQAVQDNAARNSLNQETNASSVPVPLSPGQARDGVSSPDGSALVGTSAASGVTNDAFGAGMPAPKKVKVISVRPDGSILPANDGQQASIEAATAPKPDVSPAPAVPAAPTKPTKAVKSTSRVATTKPVSIASAGDDSDAPPAKPVKATKKPKPQRVASAATEDKAAAPDQALEQATPDQQAADPAEPKASGGGFAVQLAAPGSEAEAKAAASKLGKKFADALSGHRLGFHKAESNGRSVYRVRVSSLSREDASGLCEKVKSEGGSCFVAKN